MYSSTSSWCIDVAMSGEVTPGGRLKIRMKSNPHSVGSSAALLLYHVAAGYGWAGSPAPGPMRVRAFSRNEWNPKIPSGGIPAGNASDALWSLGKAMIVG